MLGWVVAALAIVGAFGVLILRRREERRLMARLDAMLEAATEGHFNASDFDETTLSALENRLAQYLQAGSDSALRLAEQRDQLARLVSDVSHQTKTPVANIRLYSQLLAEEPLSERGRECARTTLAQAEKLDSLIQGLVRSSRLETGIIALHPQTTALQTLVESALSQYAAKAEEKGIALTQGSCTGQALCDPKWTEEALCNLIDNAIKYTPSGGHVEVCARCFELFCAVSVADDGPGIAESEQAQVFSRFYRAAAAHDKEGVGLGLYLARQIAQGQGGYIKCSSAPGKGATFTIALPKVPSQ